MNFIAFDAAYSIYPRATFEERRALSFTGLSSNDLRALGKYSLRGWTIFSDIWTNMGTINNVDKSFYINQKRWVKDKFSWVVPLDMTDIEPRPRVSSVSEPFHWDPVVQNSWLILKRDTITSMFISYHVLKPTIFRYGYLVADLALIHSMQAFLRIQGILEHSKINGLNELEKRAAWSWCVLSHLPRRVLLICINKGGMLSFPVISRHFWARWMCLERPSL